MNLALKATLAVWTLTLVLALMLAGCGSSSGGGSSAGGGGSAATGKAATSGKATTGGKGKYSSSSSAATTTTKGTPSKSASKGASEGALKTIVIKETEFELSPSTVTLSKPGTYAFKAENKGSTGHSLEIDGKGVKSKGGEVGEVKLEQTLDPGESGVLTVRFQKSGTYEMHCPIDGHRLAGMKGSVVVK
jgi:uncharacterized cupredoxin-like copper-binding protein